jgi:hypothetical protein
MTAMHPRMLDTCQSWIPATCLLVANQLASSDYKICTVCRPAQLSHSWIGSPTKDDLDLCKKATFMLKVSPTNQDSTKHNFSMYIPC